MIALLAGTATLGIVIQAVILLMFWRRTGLHVRPDFRWRGVGLDQLGRLAGWTFLMVVAGQLAGLVQSRVLSDAAEDYPGVLVTQNAWLLFMLPYSIIVLSIGTPYFTQLSEHAAAGRDDDVRGDVGRSIRTLGVFIVDRHGRPRRRLGAGVPHLHGQSRRGGRRRRGAAVLPGEPRPARRPVRHPAHVLRVQRHAHAVLLHAAAVRARGRDGAGRLGAAGRSTSRQASRSASRSRASCR